MIRSLLRSPLLGLLCFVAATLDGGQGAAAEGVPKRFDHVYVIVLENHDFDEALDSGASPFLRDLARSQGLATRYFGVTHPSLPNYLAMIGGDDYFIRDDNPSCFASNLRPGQACHKILGDSLVDQLENAELSFALYAQSLPGVGDLTQGRPPYPNDIYAQKHNPFVYFDQIVQNPARLARLKPMSALAADLAGFAPNFVFIVPDQCHDGHGLRFSCNDSAALTHDYDDTVARTVDMIRASPNWTQNSAIVVTFDEGEMHQGAASAAKPEDENRIATIVVTKCGGSAVSDARLDHFALLATIEDGFGLPRLRKAMGAPTMMDLFARPCQ